MPVSKAHLMTAGVALIAFAAVKIFQSRVMTIPVVGEFLPK